MKALRFIKFLVVEFMPICLLLLAICITFGVVIFVSFFGLGLYLLLSVLLLYFGLCLYCFWDHFLKGDMAELEK